MKTDHLPNQLWPFVWHFLKQYKKIVFLFVIITFLAGFWGPLNSLTIKYIIDTLSSPQTNIWTDLSIPAIFLVLNFLVFDNVTWRSIGYLNYKYQPLIKNKIIKDTFRYVLGGSHQFFLETLSGRVSSHINTLADNIERILHSVAADFVRGFSLLMIALISMLMINLIFFYIMLIWFILFFIASVMMSKRLIILSDTHTEAEAHLAGQVVDCISNVNTIRTFARRNDEVHRLGDILNITKTRFRNKQLHLVIMNIIQGTLIATMMAFYGLFLTLSS